MTEAEIAAWLSQPRSPIRRHGALSRDEVAEASTAYLKNGRDLMEEALILYGNQRIPRAVALAVLALEEIAKVPRVVNTFLQDALAGDPQVWKEFWKSGGSHRAKQELILAYGKTIRDQLGDEPVFAQRLYRYFAPDSVLTA
jgi:AbiV family abortive infection protein